MADDRRDLIVSAPGEHPKARSIQGWALVPAIVALSCIGAFFIAAAFYGFITGFWQLLLFFDGILYYGTVALVMDSFPEQLGRATAALVAPVLFGTIGAFLMVVVRRMSVRLKLARQRDDLRAPVVYLRSFRTDSRLSHRPRAIGRMFSTHTEEEQLVEALREIGPVIAIGKPDERLPRLGATRIYVDEADWQQQILSWFDRAALVVIHVPPDPTTGVEWEIDRSLSVVPLSRLVFVIPRDPKGLEWLGRKIRERGLTLSEPRKLPRGPYRSVSCGLVYFGSDAGAEFSPLVKPPWLRRPFSSPLVPVYRLALKPITTRAAGSWRPLRLGFGDASLAAVWITFAIVVIVFGLNHRRTDPLRRELMILSYDLRSQFPPEALQLVENGDQAAFTAWLQSQLQIGIRYMPGHAVKTHASLMRRLLAAAPVTACAEIADGTATHEVVSPLLNQLGRADQDALRAWFAFRKRALTESLAPVHAAEFPVSEEEVAEGFDRLYEALSPADGERFRRIAAIAESASADDQCWFARTWLDGLERVREPFGTKLARAAMGQEIEK